jgi:benzoate-CoA ligase family protein
MNLFQAISKNDPLAIAILHGKRSISYGELRDETLRTAGLLKAFGVAPGDRVALLLHDSPEFVEAFIAICSMGAIAVPINMALRLEEQRAIINNSGAKFALVEAGLRSTLLTHGFENMRRLRSVVSVVEVLRGAKQEAGKTWQNLKSEISSPGPIEFPEPSHNQPAFILYTSGSTGEPKGAVHRQVDIFHTNAGFCRQVLKLTPNDRLFSSSRLPFAYGLGNSFSFPLLNGAASILCTEKPTPAIIGRVFRESWPTVFFGVPVVFKLLLEHHRSGAQLDCSSLRFCVSAGEALPAHLGEEWQKEFGVPILDAIGSTEMLHMFMSNHLEDNRYGSSGKLLAGYEARLLNETGEAAAGEGNLWIKGDSAAMYYWEKPEETQRTFVDGWVRTGDLYKCDDEGYWFHMGRGDDCFKSSGQWVSPVEVEGVLIRNEEVHGVAVVEDFDTDGLPCACAFVVCNRVESNVETIEKNLRSLADQSLPRFKRPKHYRFVEDLPYTATGKVQRFKLRNELRAKRNS